MSGCLDCDNEEKRHREIAFSKPSKTSRKINELVESGVEFKNINYFLF